jgi:alkylhydroperoxidase family enzyme
MSRIDLKLKQELPYKYQELLDHETLGTLKIWQAKANNPNLLEASQTYTDTLFEEIALGKFEVELIILTVAKETSSKYIWHQHINLAAERGISKNTLEHVSKDDLSHFSSKTEVMLEYVAGLACKSVDDSLFDDLSEHFDARTIVDITMLASRYVETAHLIDALGLKTESKFVGWNPFE